MTHIIDYIDHYHHLDMNIVLIEIFEKFTLKINMDHFAFINQNKEK